MNILYIGDRIKNCESGADVVNKRNIDLLTTLPDVNLFFISPTIESLFDKCRFGISNEVLKKIKKNIIDNNISHIFISQSLLGRVAEYVHDNFQNIQIITFFHNIEIDYARAYLRSSGIKGYPFYLLARYWEKKTIENSSKVITLNSRDSDRLYQNYRIPSSLELPTSFRDKFDEEAFLKSSKTNELNIDYLFVGVAFFPNIEGIQWFIDNVMPYVEGNLYIIGKGMDKVKFNNISDKVHVMGYVEDLSVYYYKAKYVVSPIFSGAGMKTKTAEALMYGKMIVGTNEAFEGYDIKEDSMKIANTSDEFIAKLNETSLSAINTFYESSRKLFLEKYEIEKQRELILSIFQ